MVASATIDGTVVSAGSRWSAGRIVTDSVVRGEDGRDVAVTQLGGTVDGIGMVQIPAPPVLATGDRVSVRVPVTKSALPGPLPVLEVVALQRDAERKSLGGVIQPTPGYVQTMNEFGAPLHWASGCVFITYDEAGTSHLAGDLEFTVMDEVLTTWREVTRECSYLTFELTGREPIEVGFDRKNVIKFRDERWCRPATEGQEERCYGPDAAALTTLHFVNDAKSPRNGEILDADIEFNGEYFAISSGGVSLGGAPCKSDLGNTLAHEIGHLMGLDHTCRNAAEPQRLDHAGNPVPACALGVLLPPDVLDATMYAYQECGETHKATPEPDDIAGVCGIYPVAADPQECKVPSLKAGSGCALAPARAGAPSALPWLLIALVLGFRLRRRR